MSSNTILKDKAVYFDDTGNLDGFGRLRTSNPTTIFDFHQEYSYGPLIWEHYTVGTGSVVYNQSTASSSLSSGGTASGARAIRQTKFYIKYQPGKSQLIKITGILKESGTCTGSTRRCIGYHDDSNGLIFTDDATGVGVCVRTNTSGSVVDNVVYQSAWNIDKLDGTGPSGVTADFTKVQLFVIDFLWLGVARIRFGIVVEGKLIYCHYVHTTNVSTTVYMRTPNLPIRYEVFNNGGTGSNVSLNAICSAVESEGGVDRAASLTFTASNGATAKTCPDSASLTPLISLRLKDTFGSLTYRGTIEINDLNLAVSGAQLVYWEWRLNPVITGSTFANSADAESGVEFDTAATATSNGVLLASGYVASGTGSSKLVSAISVPNRIKLARNYSNVRDILSLSCRSVGGGSATVYSNVNWLEAL